MAHDKVVGVGVLESLDDFIISSIRVPKFDIFFYSCVEQNWFLSNISNLLSVVLQVDVLQISSINDHLSISGIIEPLQ